MDIEKNWEKALKHTEIIRPRIQPLATFEATEVPYILMSESLSDSGNTLVRKGSVLVEKPSLLLPASYPQLEGFELDNSKKNDADSFMSFLLVRGIRFPSLVYNNRTLSISIHDGKLSEAAKDYKDQLQQQENIHTGLILGREDCWQFSVLIFTAGQIMKSVDGDIHKILDRYKEAKGD